MSWENRADLIVPPILSRLNEKDSSTLIKTSKKIAVPKYPCPTQAVERIVKLVTAASGSVYGAAARDGLLLIFRWSQN